MKDEILFELIGSFTITFFGSFIRINNPDDFVAATLGYFLLYLGVTYCSKNHSASLFNPILSFSLLITGFIDKGKSYYLIGSQILGSIFGGFCIWSLRKTLDDQDYLGEPIINRATLDLGFILEAVGMFVLVYVYNNLFCQVNAPKHIHGTAIAATYAAFIGGFGMFSGGCMNLISLIGPTIFNSNYDDWALYIGGQLLGAILGGLIYNLFLKQEKGEKSFNVDSMSSSSDLLQNEIKQ